MTCLRHRATHPATATWTFPATTRPLPPGVSRVNLRELAADPRVFEHHLGVVAAIGDAQLECTTASEPLYFAHASVSDEYALALPTGDPMLDAFQGRTFLSDLTSGADVARYKHGALDLVLHPHGFLHWPGRLRPPYEPFRFGPGMRRRGLSLVYCGARPIPPAADRPLRVTPGREADAKRDRADVPLLLADARREQGRVAKVGDTTLELLVEPRRVAPVAGGVVIVLESDGAFAPCDLLQLAPGVALDAAGIGRALLFSSPRGAPVSCAWQPAPAPFAPFEEAPAATLPVRAGDLTIEPATAATVAIGGAEVPRYWLARLLFRLALHGFRLGYVETYGGFHAEDLGAQVALGVRGGARHIMSRDEALRAVETFYRAVAPEGYTERLS